jgi:hypothetical protein
MTTDFKRMAFAEFVGRLEEVFDSIADDDRPVLVERHGRLYRVASEPTTRPDIWANYDPERVLEVLRRSAGALTGVDRDELLADIHAARQQDSRGRPV